MTARDSDERRKADLAKLHVARKRLALDDEQWRTLVRRISTDFRGEDAAIESSGDMTREERTALIQELRRMGFEPGPPPGQTRVFGKSDEPHVRKLYACAYQLIRDGAIAPHEPACWLRKFTKRLTGIDDPRWLTAGDCNKVIEALKAWHKRLNDRAAQKCAAAPNLRVRAAGGEIMQLIATVDADPRNRARQIIGLLSRQSWPSPEAATAGERIIREGGVAVHRCFAEWDFRGAWRELRAMFLDCCELDPGLCERVGRELQQTRELQAARNRLDEVR